VWRTLTAHPGVAAGGAVVAVVVTLAIAAPLLARFGPLQVSMLERLRPPSGVHWLGTDHLGRDLWARLLHGARLSIFVGLCVSALASTAGIAVGLVGGYSRRWGNLAMRATDGLMAFPAVVLALTLIAVLGSRLGNVIVALAVVYTPRVARVMHGVVLDLREREYVLAAQALGATPRRVLTRHVLRNAIGPIIVQSSFTFANAIITEAGLSFLGVGLPPGTPSWGSVLSEGRNYMLRAPWITISAGSAIFLSVMGLNLLGDGLRDVLDPRLRGAGGQGRQLLS
jgi:peptide/nickel transport system permease protein